MSKQGVNRGATLLHVLLLTLVLSSVLLTEMHSRKQQTKSWAIDYTVAQTDMLLNAAYSYFKENKAWPDCSSWLQQARNGWGVNVYCEYANPVGGGPSANRNNAREFLIRQYVPNDVGEIYQGRYLNTDVASPGDHTGRIYPSGFSAYTVKTNRAGGASQTIDVRMLRDDGPALTDKLQCQAGENRHVFSALGGMASKINSPNTILATSTCLSIKTIPSRTVRFGHQINTLDAATNAALQTGYDMYRQRFGATFPNSSGSSDIYFDGDDIGITSSNLKGRWGCYMPLVSYYDDNNSTDGNNNAHYEIQGDQITTLVFQYCTPSQP